MTTRLRAAWTRFWHTPKPPPAKYWLSDEQMERAYPNLRRVGVTPSTDIWKAMDILAAELLKGGGDE